MLASRRSRWVVLRLASTAVYTVSPATAKTTGTRCGAPPGLIVANTAAGASANRAAADRGSVDSAITELTPP